MNFADATAYQDSLDAVQSGTFTSIQAVEVDAVIAGVQQYLASLSTKVAGYKTAVASFANFSAPVAAALEAAIDGPGPLPSPRVQIYGGQVMTATEIAAAQKALADAQAAASAQAPAGG